ADAARRSTVAPVAPSRRIPPLPAPPPWPGSPPGTTRAVRTPAGPRRVRAAAHSRPRAQEAGLQRARVRTGRAGPGPRAAGTAAGRSGAQTDDPDPAGGTGPAAARGHAAAPGAGTAQTPSAVLPA